jgi:hypothetical protein
MSTTKESKKDYEERLFNTKPKKMTWIELQDLMRFIAENNKSGKPRGSSERAPTDWTTFMSTVSGRLTSLGVKTGAMKFASYLKALGHYPSEELKELSDKDLKKLLKAHLKAEEEKPPQEKTKTKAKAKAKASLDSDSDSDSDSSSEEEAPKPKAKTTGGAKAKAKTKVVDLSDSEEDEAPKAKPKKETPKPKAKVVDLSDSEEEAPKAKSKKESPKPKAEPKEEEPKEEEKPKTKVRNATHSSPEEPSVPKAKKAKEEGPTLPTNGKGLVQMIGDTKYYTANVEGELAVYTLKEDGTGGEGLGIYNFTTKKIETEEEEEEEEEEKKEE